MKVFLWLIPAALLMSGPAATLGAETPADAGATLQLSGGDYIAGNLSDCDQAGTLRWQGSAFVSPFAFPLSAVSAVYFPMRAQRPQPNGQYCFELDGGDVLCGDLVGLSADDGRLDIPGFGLLHVQRSAIQRILHWRGGADLVYVGPNSLSEWKDVSPAGAWQQESGQLFTERAGASLFGDVGIPAQACIEIELSWTHWTFGPDFVLTIGASNEEDDQACRLEAWNHQLVLVRETADKADLASLQKLADSPGRCHFQMYLDQERGRATVFGTDGHLLADLTVPDAHSHYASGLRLKNHHGGVRLEQLRITRWNGHPPREVQADKSRLSRLDGSMVYGEIKRLDASAGAFLIGQDGRETQVPADAVESVVLPRANHSPSCDLRAIFRDGTRISGNLRKAESGRLWLSRPGIAEPLAVPATDLQTLVVLAEQKPASDAAGRSGRLEADGLKLHGCLIDGSERAGASCLVWRPHGSTVSSALKPGASAQIVYRDPPPPPPTQPATAYARPMPPPAQANGILARLALALAGNPSSGLAPTQTHRFGSALYLRTGDTIPCVIKRIDEKAVTIESSTFEVKSIATDKIKAVDLDNPSSGTKIDPTKRDRLLTLPRMQRNDPPTHLIRSVEGDYLRARLIEMDDKTVTVEVRSETRHLPREQVARIIWLNDDKSRPSAKTLSTATRVQALRDDGVRLTFYAECLAGTTLQGKSDVLGTCRVELNDLDQLIIGHAIEQLADLPYKRWKLQRAVDPKFVTADGKKGSVTGRESALVGKPAPEFELETLDGGRFRLSEHRGTIVILDFWASWCGPCMQTLPAIVQAVRKYRDQNVILLAINLQETPEAIKVTLARLGLKTTIALDQNGSVAEKYAAVAIPQTVIIDGNGNVARLFVGGGPQYVDQVRDAVQAEVTSATGQGTSP